MDKAMGAAAFRKVADLYRKQAERARTEIQLAESMAHEAGYTIPEKVWLRDPDGRGAWVRPDHPLRRVTGALILIAEQYTAAAIEADKIADTLLRQED